MNIQAQDTTIKKALKSYNKENDSLLLKYFRSHAEKKQLKELEMDSIPEPERCNGGTVYYSPDNAFKIFVFSGTLNYRFSVVDFHYSVTQFASGHIKENSGFSTIYSITPTEDGSYIIIDYNTVIASFSLEHKLKMEKHKLKKNKLMKQKLVKNNISLPAVLKDHLTKDKKSFFITLYVDTPFKDDFITYSAKDKKIYYDYTYYPAIPVYPEYIPVEMRPSYKEHLIVKGSFKLDNGTISDFKEEYEKTL